MPDKPFTFTWGRGRDQVTIHEPAFQVDDDFIQVDALVKDGDRVRNTAPVDGDRLGREILAVVPVGAPPG